MSSFLKRIWCESTLFRKFAQRALRAVSKVSTQIWAFLKNLAFEESSSHSTTLSAKHLFTFFFLPSLKTKL